MKKTVDVCLQLQKVDVGRHEFRLGYELFKANA